MLNTFSLVEITNNEITRQHGPFTVRTPTFYPSEASLRKEDGTIQGTGCHRKTFFRIRGVEPTNRSGPTNSWRASLGSSAERTFTDLMKQAGVWEANSIKFYDPDLNLSGEVDVVGKIPFRDGYAYYGVEVKSIYGYAVTQCIRGRRRWRGSPAIIPKPKLSHLMQSMLYTWHFRDDLIGFKLIYISRDSGDTAEYNITLERFTDDEGNTKHCAKVNGEAWRDVVLEDIHDRYRELRDKLLQEDPPEREFKLVYTQEEAEALHASGELSATRFNKFQKGEAIGDWQCSYCSFKDHCYAE